MVNFMKWSEEMLNEAAGMQQNTAWKTPLPPVEFDPIETFPNKILINETNLMFISSSCHRNKRTLF